MKYFSRKVLMGILAEQPDMMASFPECVLSARQREDMAQIPDIALLDCTMLCDPAGLARLFAAAPPDAVLPVLIYGGVERVRWSAFDAVLAGLKQTLERRWHVHMLPPVVVGAPAFRSALYMYAAARTQHAHSAMLCAICRFYRAAVCVPLCKLCSISRMYCAGLASCCMPSVVRAQSAEVLKYCAILPAGYGIDLSMDVPVEATVQGRAYSDTDEPVYDCFCVPPEPAEGDRPELPKGLLQRYFETFAIPFSANVMSRLLAGHEVDFVATAHECVPVEKRN